MFTLMPFKDKIRRKTERRINHVKSEIRWITALISEEEGEDLIGFIDYLASKST